MSYVALVHLRCTQLFRQCLLRLGVVVSRYLQERQLRAETRQAKNVRIRGSDFFHIRQGFMLTNGDADHSLMRFLGDVLDDGLRWS